MDTTEKPLFIPLKTKYYRAFCDGLKTHEYRLYGARWNERTCRVGRRVIISNGYGKRDRRCGVITGFTKSHVDSADWLACYGSPGVAACIEIKLTETPT